MGGRSIHTLSRRVNAICSSSEALEGEPTPEGSPQHMGLPLMGVALVREP